MRRERVADVDVRRHDLLHREDLVQLLGGDRLLEDALEQQAGEAEHDRHHEPSRSARALVTAMSTIAIADGAGAERDDLVAQDQRLLLVEQLVADAGA